MGCISCSLLAALLLILSALLFAIEAPGSDGNPLDIGPSGQTGPDSQNASGENTSMQAAEAENSPRDAGAQEAAAQSASAQAAPEQKQPASETVMSGSALMPYFIGLTLILAAVLAVVFYVHAGKKEDAHAHQVEALMKKTEEPVNKTEVPEKKKEEPGKKTGGK